MSLPPERRGQLSLRVKVSVKRAMRVCRAEDVLIFAAAAVLR